METKAWPTHNLTEHHKTTHRRCLEMTTKMGKQPRFCLCLNMLNRQVNIYDFLRDIKQTWTVASAL